MKITKEEIEHIATLSRLSLSEDEKDSFGSQLSSILDYMEKLDEIDTKDIKPTSHVLALSNILRDDIQKPSISKDNALKNATDHTDKFYRVPKIID